MIQIWLELELPASLEQRPTVVSNIVTGLARAVLDKTGITIDAPKVGVFEAIVTDMAFGLVDDEEDSDAV